MTQTQLNAIDYEYQLQMLYEIYAKLVNEEHNVDCICFLCELKSLIEEDIHEIESFKHDYPVVI